MHLTKIAALLPPDYCFVCALQQSFGATCDHLVSAFASKRASIELYMCTYTLVLHMQQVCDASRTTLSTDREAGLQGVGYRHTSKHHLANSRRPLAHSVADLLKQRHSAPTRLLTARTRFLGSIRTWCDALTDPTCFALAVSKERSPQQTDWLKDALSIDSGAPRSESLLMFLVMVPL